MEEQKLKELIYNKFVKPTENRDDSYLGVEIEMPVINLSGEKADQKLAQDVFEKFVDNYGFNRENFDENNVCFSATDPVTGDNISFDCSYNNLELSFGIEEDLNPLYDRFKEYVEFLNSNLKKENHLLSGFGINPNHKVNDSACIPVERYRMMGQYVENAKKWNAPFEYHEYVSYPTLCSASQIQLDVTRDNLLDVLNSFTQLEPYKAILFSNSRIEEEPDFNCVRDYLYENSTIGLNPHNIGVYEKPFESIDEFLEYKLDSSLFNVSRDGKYILFEPIPLREYFDRESIKGEVYNGKEFEEIEFTPEDSDLDFFRTYDFEDLTFRGTVEFRSNCNQPFCNSMSSAAAHLGWIKMLPELKELLKEDPLLDSGLTSKELREIAVRTDWRDKLDEKQVQKFLKKLVELANKGLLERGRGENKFLEPLFYRVDNLVNPSEFLNENFKGNEEAIIEKFASFDEENPLILE